MLEKWNYWWGIRLSLSWVSSMKETSMLMSLFQLIFRKPFSATTAVTAMEVAGIAIPTDIRFPVILDTVAPPLTRGCKVTGLLQAPAPADRWIETGLLGRALKPTSFIIRRSLDSKRPWKLLLSVCGWVDGRKSRTWLFHRHCHASMCTRLIYVDKSVLTGLPSVYNYRLWFMQVFQCLTDVSHYNQSAANGGNVELISPISPDPIMNTLSTVMFPVWRDQAVGTCAGPLFQDLPGVTES